MPASREQGTSTREIIKLWVLGKRTVPQISKILNLPIREVETIISHSYYKLTMHEEGYWRQVIAEIKKCHSDKDIYAKYPVSRSFIKEVRKLCESPA